MSIVVNLFGSPGAGKSTGAAYIFAELKLREISCELVTEYAKGKVWENSIDVLGDQIYIFGKQYHKTKILLDKVDLIITDSPILLSAFYSRFDKSVKDTCFEDLVWQVHNSMNNLNFFVHRAKSFSGNGRLQNEEESEKMSKDINEMLDKIPLDHVSGDRVGYETIVETCLKAIDKHDLI